MHLEALDEKRRGLFSRLAAFDDFYLAGGTALALEIGHRISLDFDLFSAKPIPEAHLKKVERVFGETRVSCKPYVPLIFLLCCDMFL